MLATKQSQTMNYNLLSRLQRNLKSQTAFKGSIAIIDQCIVSGVTFLTGIILARSLKVAEFGIFVLAYSILLFTNNVQISLVTGPMMVLSAPLKNEKLRQYITSTGVSQLFLSALIAILILFISNSWRIFSPATELPAVGNVLAFTIFCFQSQQFFRRTLFSRMDLAGGLLNDTISYGLQITGILILLYIDQLSACNALYIIAISAAIAVIIGSVQCKKFLTKDMSGFKQTIMKNWNHGRWLLGSSLSQWICYQSYFFITAFFLGTVGPAILKACQNIIAPTHIVLQSLENIIPSTASRKFTEGGMPVLRKFLNEASINILALIIPYCLFVSIFAERFLKLFYQNLYKDYGIIVVLIAIQYIIDSLNREYMFGLRVLDKPHKIFLSFFYASIVTVIISIPLVKFFGVKGSVFGLIISVAIVLFTVRYYFNKAIFETT